MAELSSTTKDQRKEWQIISVVTKNRAQTHTIKIVKKFSPTLTLTARIKSSDYSNVLLIFIEHEIDHKQIYYDFN